MEQNQESGRKRQLEELEMKQQEETPVDNLTATIQDTAITNNNIASNTMPPIHRLLLEAVFHPKFENETRNNQEIRNQMKSFVKSEKGYLEVSLKHSGSLLLWSGGQRFYSKNATENKFTHVGEIILRQHFVRAWWDDGNNFLKEEAFVECSKYIQQHRLTLAFELVTSVLGHHGAIPRQDFMILTAVADRKLQRFYSTAEVVALAQTFRLPHNDSWVFASLPSAEALFDLYDGTRETGLANDTLAALDKFASVHVCSMYPHEQFQGNILEGIVIRYVPYCNETTKDKQLRVLNQLSDTSREILQSKVPPARPCCFELVGGDKKVPSILATNVRKVFEECMAAADNAKTRAEKQDLFASTIYKVLLESDGNRRIVERWNGDKKNNVNFPAMVKKLLSRDESLDRETRRIANMISTVDSLKGRVEYKLLREKTTREDDNGRWLCVVHVHFDSTFQKYHKSMNQGDMPLYRGCCLELVAQEEDGGDDATMIDRLTTTMTENADDINNDNGTLMLKMKFLPYMVRTFGCRNGLSTLKNGGTEAFLNYTMKLMNKWGISNEAINKWQPYFRAWAFYAYPMIANEESNENSAELGDSMPLDATFYLDHLEKFNELYNSGKLKQDMVDTTKPFTTFRGLVVVVALEKDSAASFAAIVAQELGGVRQCSNLRSIKDQDLIRSQVTHGGGIVCTAVAEDGVKDLRKHFKKFADSISVVLVGCDKESMESLSATEQDRVILASKADAWRKSKCAVVEVPGSALLANDEDVGENQDIQNMFKKLWETSKAIAKPDMRPGLVLFFPGIPGCGKSTLCDAESSKKIEQVVKASVASGDDEKSEPTRKVLVLEGDKCKKKYWQVVKQQRGMNPASICIADKNVPPPAWSIVGDICSQTRGIPVPVLPDDASLVTTTITGARFADGSFNKDVVHYYPFSLHYVAVCMARVINRPSGSHNGKLDSSTESACMIVAMFVGLYRNIAADQFCDVLRRKIEASGAMEFLSPIRVPFFVEQDLPPLSSDLDAVLRKALQLQYGGDKARKNAENKSELNDMESQLRSVLTKHNDMLQGLSVDEKLSRESFLSQVEERIKELQSLGSSSGELLLLPPPSDKSDFIKIVSVDVCMNDVHSVLRSCAKLSEPVLSFLEMASEGSWEQLPSSKGTQPGGNFVKNTHMTMAHFNEMEQSAMHELYDSVMGHPVEIEVNGLLWSDSVAALSVSIASVTNDNQRIAVPPSRASFPHITVWFRQGEKAVLSNELPNMLKAGAAERFDLQDPIKLEGAISFWSNDKTSSP